MVLRKCPACKNMVTEESENCPICGCNPRVRLVRALIFWMLTLAGAAWILREYAVK